MNKFIPTYKSKYNTPITKSNKSTFTPTGRTSLSRTLGGSYYDKYRELCDDRFTPIKYKRQLL